MASALATVHTIRGEPICTSVIGVTLPPRSGSGNLDQHSPSSCIPLHEFLCGCWSRDAIMALLLAGVRTVYRWPTCIVVGWCSYSLQVAYMHCCWLVFVQSAGGLRALLLAGVCTVCRWPTCIVVGWCLYSLQVAYMHCCWLVFVQSAGGLHAQFCGVTLAVSRGCGYFHQNTSLSGWPNRTIKCEFQCVLCIAWSLHHNYVLLYALSWEQLICFIITTDNIAEKCYPIYGDMCLETNGSGHILCKIFNLLLFFDKESYDGQLVCKFIAILYTSKIPWGNVSDVNKGTLSGYI